MGSKAPIPGKCGAKLRGQNDGTFCPNPIMSGTTRCRMHAGAYGHQAHQRAKVEDQARKLLIGESFDPIDNPVQVLLDLAAEARAFKDAVRTIVNDLNAIRYSTEGGEQLRAEVQVYERALDRAGRFMVDVVKLNLEERLVQIRESEAQRMFAALEAALAAVGLDEGQQREARRVAGRHLRAV